ncbi:ABC transporter [Thermocladium modestius]|uniref:ABC transporter n=1 Tax=Thermocladium modestius TaxID=62609 RepID=A0A830GVK4_9CREN|nr:ABC transporter ATP-binding protein [Thermocladium modestius]GGP20609.1 ABC transporter [Thermocladium modestius]
MDGLSVDGLRVSIGGTYIIKDISFNVKRGRIACLLGPNGAGKTTIIKSIMGLMPFSGVIKIDGVPMDPGSNEFKKIVGYVPESPLLFDSLTVEETIQFISSVRGLGSEHSDWIKWLLNAFGLDAQARKLISSLSIGTRQKISIVTALMHRPEVLLLDEPFNWLDIASIVILRELLNKYKDNGRSILMATHMLDVAERLCSEVILINNGAVLNIVDSSELSKDKLEKLVLEETEMDKYVKAVLSGNQ